MSEIDFKSIVDNYVFPIYRNEKYQKVLKAVTKYLSEGEKIESGFKGVLMSGIKTGLYSIISTINPSDSITTIIDQIFHTKHFELSLNAEIILRFKYNSADLFIYATAEDVIKYTDKIITKSVDMQKILDNLVANKKLVKIDNYYWTAAPSIKEFLDTNIDDERWRQIIKMRLQGRTLQECADLLGVTRERIRQICMKAAVHFPVVDEMRYLEFFEKYSFQPEAFCEVFDVEPSAYYFLDSFYKKGDLEPSKILDDENCPEYIKTNFKKLLGKTSVRVDGSFKKASKILLLEKFLKKNYDNQTFTIEEILDRYNQFVKDSGIKDFERFTFTKPEDMLPTIERSRNIVLSANGIYRHYNLNAVELTPLFSSLGIDGGANSCPYQDLEISAQKLWQDHKDLMDQYGISNDYELFGILKNTESEWNQDHYVKMRRIPMMVFGNPDRKKQILHALRAISPATAEQFAEKYSEIYGVKPQTVIMNLLPYIAEYKKGQIYDISSSVISLEQVEKMSKNLTKDFYFIDDFYKLCGVKETEKLNDASIKKLGYLPYGNYVIPTRYGSASNFFDHYFSQDFIDLNNLETKQILTVLLAYNTFAEKRKNFDYIEYEPKQCISFKKLQSVEPELKKEHFVSYVEQVIAAMSDHKYFTVKHALKAVQDSILNNFGFSNHFFNSVLINSRSLKNFVYAKVTVFTLSENPKPSFNGLIEQIIIEHGAMDIDEFNDILKDDYGIITDRNWLISRLNEADIYYDAIMEKVYLTIEDYHSEIARKVNK